MPLQSGSSPDVIRQNIGEILHTRKERGGRMKFGAHGPLKAVSAHKARQIAAAIAERKAREG